MKKLFALLLAAILCLSLVACGGEADPQPTEENTLPQEEEVPAEPAPMTKDELLAAAKALTREEIEKSIGNVAYANSLVGNVYTFGGTVESVEADHAVITFYIQDAEGNYSTSEFVMVAQLYLPQEDLIQLQVDQRLSFVAKLDAAASRDESIPDFGAVTIMDLTFRSAAIVSDRFENTGTLHSRNASYGEDAWNIKFPNNDYLSVVHFREDVSAHQGEEITYSYQITGDGCVDAYIVE